MQIFRFMAVSISGLSFILAMSMSVAASQSEKTSKPPKEQGSKNANQSVLPDCVYPESDIAAPDWICDAPVPGYALTVVGDASAARLGPQSKLSQREKAFLFAIGRMAEQIDTRVDGAKKKTPGNSSVLTYDPEKGTSSTNKQLSTAKFGKNIAVFFSLKQYAETTVTNGKEEVDEVFSASTKLEMTSPCVFTMQRFIETTRKDDKPIDVSDKQGTQCEFADVLKELSRAGVDIVKTATAPNGTLFLLLGSKEDILTRRLEQASKTDLSAEKAAWRKFQEEKARREMAEEISGKK